MRITARRTAGLIATVIVTVGLSACATKRGPFKDGFDAFAEKDYATAEIKFLEALEDDPDDPYVQLNLGAVYHNTGRPELAKPFYLKVLETGKDVRPSRKANTEETDKKNDNPTLAELAQINLDLLSLVPIVHPVAKK